jgi:hypothetical protein
MSLIFADFTPELGWIGTGSFTSTGLSSQTGNRACFKFIRWISFQLHSRFPGGSLTDSGRIPSRTKTVPTGLFMNLSKRSHAPSLAKDPLLSGPAMDPEKDLTAVAECAATCINKVIPHPIAIFVPDKKTCTYNAGDFPAKHLAQIRNHFESNAHLLTDLLQESKLLADPYRFSDGSLAFFLPIAHEGSIEAVLCLYDRSGQDQVLLQQSWSSLEPICHLTGMALSRSRGDAAGLGNQSAVPSAGSPKAMAQLIYGLLRTISHDIRTPMTTVRGFVKMMLDGRTGSISDPQRECLQMAFQGVDQLIKIGTSISDASGHIEKIHPEIVDVPALWQTVTEASRPQLIAKSATIESKIEGDRRSVCGDRQYLTKLFERLLVCAINAVKPQGKLDVNFRCRNEITLMLTVLGVQGAQPPGDTDQTLASANEIAFLHGGKITVRQGKEGESIFMLVLPGYNE